MAGGSVICANVQSVEDEVLCGTSKEGPSLTYFQGSFGTHGRFCRESVELPVTGQVGADSTVFCDLGKAGDLLGKIWIRFTFPGIRHPKENCKKSKDEDSSVHSQSGSSHSGSSHSGHSGSDSSSEVRDEHYWATWNNSIAHVAAQNISLDIARNTICQESGTWLEICDEHMLKAGKENNEIVGRFPNFEELWKASRSEQSRYAAPRFWFCENIDQVIPIVAVHYSQIQLRVDVAPLQNLFLSSDGSTPYLMNANRELSARDIKISVFADIYWLTDAERQSLNQQRHHFLISQVQYNGGYAMPKNTGNTQTALSFKLPFQHPVYELVWIVQQERHKRSKDFFNFSGSDGGDPISHARITINNHDLESGREAKWFRLQEPFISHTNIPKKHIYSRAWALFPENTTQPSGHFAAGRLSDVSLHLTPAKGLNHSIVHVWAKTRNVFRILKGMCGNSWQ